MNKELLKQIIKESQGFKLPFIIPRNIELPLNSNKVITITGPRRSGKTFLLYAQIQKLFEGEINPNKILYINFDDPRLLPCTAIDLEDLLESYFELYPEIRDTENFIFFDEIQNVTNWELFIRRINDTRNFNIFLTGSSSKLLSKEIATQLRGRAVNFEIMPFSFQESLWAHKIYFEKNMAYSKDRFLIKKVLEEYLETGGFPEIVLEENNDLKMRILREYLETMFIKDLIERYNVNNHSVLRELTRYLASNISTLFSINAFWKWIKQAYPVTKRTIIQYIEHLQDIGLFCLTKKFSFSLKEQTTSPAKVYIIDNGLRMAYGFNFSKDTGKVLENTVFLKLKHLQLRNPAMEIFYWQDYNKREIDFVVKEGIEIKSLIQVCADVNDFKTKEREISSLIKAQEELNCKKLEVITIDYENEEYIQNIKISFKPLWKWLLLSE